MDPETEMDAATSDDAPAARSRNDDAVNVDPFIARSNVTLTLVLVETPLAPDPGDWLKITGGVAAAAVVNDQLKSLPSATPLVSVTFEDIVAEYVAPAASNDEGVSVAVDPETLIDAATLPDGPVKKKVEEENDEPLMARENVALTLVPVETLVAPEAGAMLVTDGGVTADPYVATYDPPLAANVT